MLPAEIIMHYSEKADHYRLYGWFTRMTKSVPLLADVVVLYLYEADFVHLLKSEFHMQIVFIF